MNGGSKPRNIVVGAPVPDLGENRYLTHFTSEIIVDEQLAGYLLFTRYDHESAFNDKMPLKWMIRRDSYIELVQDLLIDSTCRVARLPLDIIECIPDEHGTVVILDDITCKPEKFEVDVYEEAIRELISYVEEKSDALLVHEPQGLAKYLGGIDQSPTGFWNSLGVYQTDSDKFLYSSALLDHIKKTPSEIDL